MLVVTSILLVCICKYTMCLPCLTNESKKSFNDTRKALTALETYIGETINTLESNLGTLKSDVGSKIKNLNGKLNVLEDDFSKQRWLKYNGHCYYYANQNCDWFTAERRCREIGGYILKVDNSSENTWISDNKPNKNAFYWIGLTDLKEGDWRWTFDQSRPTYKPWQSGFGARGIVYNCGAYNYGSSYFRLWIDWDCSSNIYYICESNFCF
ncbi:perlucin-like protein [Mytilus edulis]|uniref:perlucin-like protein n=1 Tax=Mytilus edulis TaxID=6550 RepID=UPI0039EE8527